MYKNIAKQEKLLLKDLVDYQDGQVVSKTLLRVYALSGFGNSKRTARLMVVPC